LYGNRPAVLFFYPKSFTGGCTREVQAYRDRAKDFNALDAVVIGVSQDDVSTQRKFCDEYGLPYDLIADIGGKITKAFGIPERKAGITSRWTVVVGRDGKVITVDQNVGEDIEGHPARVLDDLRQDWKRYVAGFTPLFNGKDIDNWVPIKASADTWTVADGVLRCSGKPVCYLRTDKDYRNYTLLLEFAYPEKIGNAGVLVHISGEDKVWPKSLEPNLNVGQMGKIYEIDGAKVTFGEKNPLRDYAVSPGDWHRYEITCRGDTITLVIDGVVVNRVTRSNITSGKIGLQSENVPIHFRTVAIKSLEN
jgi:peroxiredoxin